MKTKEKKVTGYHLDATPVRKPHRPRPDPVQLGEELSVFLRDMTVLWQKDSLSWRDSPESEAFLRIIWERDFWREKALNP